ncbi:hypothetical protein M3Y97_00619700 [Aphelenchoides bicaudatus]|nr:hypothetical protein M3Y97_00619700 [Aphelenchoides bicaudatus]
MLRLGALLFVCTVVAAEIKNPIRGIHCSKNQAVNKITVYEDGAIEAECGPIPCGETGEQCINDIGTNCKSETDIAHGFKWSKNGQSLLLRCCTINAPGKVYVGTDTVPLGSFYTGGMVAKKDMYASGGGPEYDFVGNVRLVQGGLRIWVYRIMCPNTTVETQQPVEQFSQQPTEEEKATAMDAHRRNLLRQIADSQHEVLPSVDEQPIQEPSNPLQYRPAKMMAARQRDSPLPASQRVL